MDFNWKRAVLDAQRRGHASSGSLAGFKKIRFYLDSNNGNQLMMKTVHDTAIAINAMEEIPVRTIHFRAGNRATFTLLNTHDIAIIEAFTQAIIRGEVRITGSYSCVNNLGSQPLPNAFNITAKVPVPIKIGQGDEYYIKTAMVKVTRGGASWNIHTGHVESVTTSGGGRTQMEPQRVYMCGSSAPQPGAQQETLDPNTVGSLSGSLATLPRHLVHNGEQLSQVVLQDFNNLVDLHLNHIVVEDASGLVGMTPIFLADLEDNWELGFYHNGRTISQRLSKGPNTFIEMGFEPFTCVGPEGLPDLVVFSRVEMKRSYRVMKALATDYSLVQRDYRLKQALQRYLKTFPNAKLQQISRAFGSTPLAFLTHISRQRICDTPFKGYLSHMFLSPNTTGPAIHVPAYCRKDLEGYTLGDAGSRDISLVHGCTVTYSYDEGRNVYVVLQNEDGQAKVDPDARVG